MALGSFELDIARFVAKAKGNTDEAVRRISHDLFKRVVSKSPVATGRFKSNWLSAIGSIPAGTIETIDINGSMARVDAVTRQAKAGDILYLINNLEYARALEYGHSKQAPAGMVRLTIEEYSGVVKSAVNEVSK